MNSTTAVENLIEKGFSAEEACYQVVEDLNLTEQEAEQLHDHFGLDY